MACKARFHNNSVLEDHAKAARHAAFMCACNTSFTRLSSLQRHINANTGSRFHCGLCEDKTLPRMDKLYDHLRALHKVSMKILDECKTEALANAKGMSQLNKTVQAPGITTQVTPTAGFGSTWLPAGQTNGMVGGHTMNMTLLSPNTVNSTHLPNFTEPFNFADF